MDSSWRERRPMSLEEFRKALKCTEEIEITVIGRKTGRQISRTVWFVNEGGTLYLLPVTGSDSEWYKNLLKTPTILLKADGVKWDAKGTPITDDAKVHDIADKFRARYGAGEVRKYYSKFDVAVVVPLA